MATEFSVNNFDMPRIRSLLVSSISYEDNESTINRNRDLDGRLEPTEANIGQLIPDEKNRLMEILEKYKDTLRSTPKVVDTCYGPPMILQNKDPNDKPYVRSNDK